MAHGREAPNLKKKLNKVQKVSRKIKRGYLMENAVVKNDRMSFLLRINE